MMKVTVLYNHPTDPTAFEDYYANTYMALVGKVDGIAKAELTKFAPGPDGAAPDYYRMGEMYFESAESMQTSMQTPEMGAAVADLENFADGGVKMLVGALDG